MHSTDDVRPLPDVLRDATRFGVPLVHFGQTVQRASLGASVFLFRDLRNQAMRDSPLVVRCSMPEAIWTVQVRIPRYCLACRPWRIVGRHEDHGRDGDSAAEPRGLTLSTRTRSW